MTDQNWSWVGRDELENSVLVEAVCNVIRKHLGGEAKFFFALMERDGMDMVSEKMSQEEVIAGLVKMCDEIEACRVHSWRAPKLAS